MSEDKEKGKHNSKDKNEADFPTLSHIDSVEEIGTQIGSYKLLSVLGEGGFGIVYRADQKGPIRRQVALKVIKPGMDSKQVIARFESERQALALLDHPNIAHVFDGGTTESGRPYFVMELVKGLPITEYCDKQKLRIEERLKLFQQVCEAVQHAHQKGIIHRDLKPSNILVSVQENKAIPKIIDFGVAKAISQPLTERTLFTEQGQFIGTPEYMSPEQAGISIEGIDTRSDIYSLGVVLYEILTGALPFSHDELGRAGRAEIQRIIRESEPPRPSTKLSSLGEEAKKVAKRRHTEVAALTKRLNRELEWIPLKAMRKEPDRRYKTASELADDVSNYLRGVPLIAGPPSVVYRLRKCLSRNHVKVAMVVIIIATISVVSLSFKISEEAKIRIFKTEATEFLKNGAYQQAEETFAKILALDIDDFGAQHGISRARDQQELSREIELAERYLDDSKFAEAAGVARSVQQRFPQDPRALEIMRRANGTATLSVEFNLGRVIQASLREVTDKRFEPTVALQTEELIGSQGVDISPGWHWLTISYYPSDQRNAQEVHVKKYLLFVRRLVPYKIYSKRLLVGNVPVADFKNLKEALLNCQPGYILSLAPGEHYLNDPNAPFTDFHTGIPNVTIESHDPKEQATLVFHCLYIQSTWDFELSNLRLLGVKRRTEAYPGTVCIENSARCAVRDCNIERSRLRAENCDGLDIKSNIFTNSSHHMLWISNSRRVVIADNKEAKPNSIHNRSFLFEDCKILLLIGNVLDRSSLMGLSLNQCSNTVLVGNVVKHNWEGQIRLSNCWGAILACNEIVSDGWYGIYVLNDPFPAMQGIASPETLIHHNEIKGGRGAVFSHSAYNVHYMNNLITDANAGIFFERGGERNSIEKNIFLDNTKIIGIGDFEKQWWSRGSMRNNIVDQTIDCRVSGPIRIHFMDVEDNTVCDFKLGKVVEDAIYLPIVSEVGEQNLALRDHAFGPATGLKTNLLEACELLGRMTYESDLRSPELNLDDRLGKQLTSRLDHFANLISESLAPDIDQEYLGALLEQLSGTNELIENPVAVPAQAKSFCGHHYLVFQSSFNWRVAKEYCEFVGGHLVTITSKEEHDWIRQTFPPSWRFWLGGNDEIQEGNWEWVTGEKWEYSSWNDMEPNNQGKAEHALNMWQNGNWNDGRMERQLPFLIEWDY